MATTLKQIQSQKQKLAPKQVLNARLLQLNVVNLEQTILKELEQNPTLEQLDPVEDENVDLEKNNPAKDMDVSIEDMYSNESNYYFSEQKKEIPIPDQNTFLENLIESKLKINLIKAGGLCTLYITPRASDKAKVLPILNRVIIFFIIKFSIQSELLQFHHLN